MLKRGRTIKSCVRKCQGEQDGKVDVSGSVNWPPLPAAAWLLRRWHGLPGRTSASRAGRQTARSAGMFAARPAGRRGARRSDDRRRLDRTHAAHDHLLPPAEPRRRRAGVHHARIGDRRGQQRALRRRQLRRRLAEVGPRRRFSTVDPVTPLDHIQIDLQDALLGQLGFEPPRDDQLAQLAQRDSSTARDRGSSRAAA